MTEATERPKARIPKGKIMFRMVAGVALAVSAMWVSLCLVYALSKADIATILTISPDRIGMGVIGMISVPLLLWTLLANWQRNRQLNNTAEMFRRQIRILNQTIVKHGKQTGSDNDGSLYMFEAAQTAFTSLKNIKDDLGRESQALRDVLESVRGTAGPMVSAVVSTVDIDAINALAETSFAKLESVLKQVENSGDRILDNARIAGDTVRETVERLEMASRDSESTMGAMVESLTALSKKVEITPSVIFPDIAELASIVDRLVACQREMNEAMPARVADMTMEKAQALVDIDHLVRQKGQIEGLVAATNARLDEIAGRFDKQVASVGDAERQIAEGLEKIGAALARTRQEQEDATRDLESLGERTGGLSVRLDGLRAAAVNGASDIISEADRLQKRAETLSNELRGHSGVIADAAGRATEIGTVLRATSTLMSEVTDRASEASRQILGQFDAASREIEAQGTRLADRAGQATGVLDQARLQMESAVSNVETTLSGLDRKAGEINFAVSSSLSRLSELTHGLERARSEVVGSSADVGARLEATMTMLRNGISEIRVTATDIGQASEQADQVTQRLTTAGDVLRDRLDEIVRSADDASQRLAGATDEVSTTAERARSDLNVVGDRIRQEGEVVAAMLTRVGSVELALRGVGTMIDEVTLRAAQTAEQARESLASLGREIATQSAVATEGSGMTGEALERTRVHMQGVATQVDEAFGNLNRKAGEINFTVSTAVNRLGELMRGLETAKQTADTSAEAIAIRLTNATGAIKDEFMAVDEVSVRALERLDKASAALSAGAVDVQAEIHASEARLSAIAACVRERNAEIDRSVDHAVEGFERAERSLSEGQQKLSAAAEDTTTQFLRLLQELASGKAEFANVVGMTAEKLADFSAQVETRFTTIVGIADGARQTMDSFSSDLDKLGNKGSSLSQTLADTGQTLRTDIDSLVRLTQTSAETMRETVSGFTAGSSEIVEAAGRARTEIQRVANNLREETNSINATQEAARGLADQASSMLRDKAREMAEAARIVALQTQALREADIKEKRNLFVAAAKTVLDNLQSLSVDLAKVLDKDLPEKMWKGATRGDMPLFAKRLAGLREQIPINDVRTRFMADSQFRGHVLAYMGQFEELLDQISTGDQADVLTSALMSSDVGKIYYFLTAAVGRDRTKDAHEATG